MSASIYESVTNSIIEALEQGVIPWRKPWRGGEALPCNAITQRSYRGVNVFLLSLSRFSDHRWLTFKQIQDKGGRVKVGERSTKVVFWKLWRPPEPESNEAPTVPRHAPILRTFNVFNVEQCEELGIPDPYAPPEHPNECIIRAEQLVRFMPDAPRIVSGPSAWYRPSDDTVQVPPIERFKSSEAFYATLFHELGHATGHERRLNRGSVTGAIQFGSGVYSQEELVAELTSAFCCATAEIDNSIIEDAASYIQGWLTVLKSDVKALVIAGAQAQRAADFIRGVRYTP